MVKKEQMRLRLDKELYQEMGKLDICELCKNPLRFWQLKINAFTGIYHHKCFKKKYGGIK